MLPAVKLSGSFTGSETVTRTITADNNTSNAKINHTSLRAAKCRLSFDVITFPSGCLVTLSLPVGNPTSGSCLVSLFVILRGVVWRLSSEDER